MWEWISYVDPCRSVKLSNDCRFYGRHDEKVSNRNFFRLSDISGLAVTNPMFLVVISLFTFDGNFMAFPLAVINHVTLWHSSSSSSIISIPEMLAHLCVTCGFTFFWDDVAICFFFVQNLFFSSMIYRREKLHGNFVILNISFLFRFNRVQFIDLCKNEQWLHEITLHNRGEILPRFVYDAINISFILH